MDSVPRTKHRRRSISCILPPYILIEISKNGTPEQRAQALETLSLDHSFRAVPGHVRGRNWPEARAACDVGDATGEAAYRVRCKAFAATAR